jgi:hypothetical protein
MNVILQGFMGYHVIFDVELRKKKNEVLSVKYILRRNRIYYTVF